MSASPNTTAEGLCGNGCGRPRAVVGESPFQVTLPYCQACSLELHGDELRQREEERQEVAARLRDRLLADVGIRYARTTLASYPADTAERANARKQVLAWVDRALAGDRRNLLLYGRQGEGKTGLAIGAARALIDRGIAVRYFKAVDWLDAARTAQFDDDVKGLGKDELASRSVAFVVLDDLGTERGTPFAAERLFALVNHRYCHELPMIVTSNFAPSKLIASMAKDDVVGGRIVSRLVEDAVQVRLESGDLRLRAVA